MRTLDQMSDAIDALFRYRADAGLEAEAMARRRLSILWIDPEEYAMCSENTQALGDIYVQFMGDSGDLRALNYAGMLNSLITWLEET